jgi:hypothetical protein
MSLLVRAGRCRLDRSDVPIGWYPHVGNDRESSPPSLSYTSRGAHRSHRSYPHHPSFCGHYLTPNKDFLDWSFSVSRRGGLHSRRGFREHTAPPLAQRYTLLFKMIQF